MMRGDGGRLNITELKTKGRGSQKIGRQKNVIYGRPQLCTLIQVKTYSHSRRLLSIDVSDLQESLSRQYLICYLNLRSPKTWKF